MMKFDENIGIDDIVEFTTPDGKVHMLLKNGQEVVFDVMASSFDRYYFFMMLNSIRITRKEIHLINYTSVEAYAMIGNDSLKMNDINKVLKELGVSEDPNTVFWKLLEEYKINILKEYDVESIKKTIANVFQVQTERKDVQP